MEVLRPFPPFLLWIINVLIIPGLFCTGSWRYHYLYPVSWTEESRDGKQISQAGTFYHNSHFCLHRCAWTCFPCTALALFSGKSGRGCYGEFHGVFLLCCAVLSFLLRFDAGASIFRAQENTRGPMVIPLFQCDEYCGKWNSDLGISYGSCRAIFPHWYQIFCAVVLYQLRKNRAANCGT